MIAMTIDALQAAYRDGSLTPSALIEDIIQRTEANQHMAWITRLPADRLRTMAQRLEATDPVERQRLQQLPLYGIPFAIKDNIDLADTPTTAACPDFAFVPGQHAFVVQQLIDAGAIPIGKTNLDQFATGLNGTRSPYGACRNAFNPDYVSGGSSSGSAVAVALGYCSFALGTDTAGSGRVPASFNNLVGHKPTCGWLSGSGMLPACRSLDTISILALTAQDAETVLGVAAQFDAADPYSRPVAAHGFDFGAAPRFRFGVPRAEDLNFFGNAEAQLLFDAAVAQLKSIGGERVEISLAPFLETARLLYDGPWVAERYAAIQAFFDGHSEATLPVIQTIVGGSKKWSAADAYRYAYQLKAQKRVCDAILAGVDCIVTPTAGTVYRIDAMQANPIQFNSNLGYYTNFMNLLDYAATAVPTGFYAGAGAEGLAGMPFGVTLFAGAHQDAPLLHLAARLQRAAVATVGARGQPLPAPAANGVRRPGLPDGQVAVAVCGAHLAGLPLNTQLTSRGARLLTRTQSAPVYRMFALAGGPPYRPAMVRVADGGVPLEVEVWTLPASAYGSFVAGIPAPLGIGPVVLADGSTVQGFVCDAVSVMGCEDISHFGGWRSYLSAR